MNKLLTKIASLFFGMGLAIGVGAAIGNQRPLEARAANKTVVLTNMGANIGGTSNTTMATTDITGDDSKTYTINYLQCKKQGNAMLLAKSTGAFVSNHTAMPGAIKSVTLHINSGAAAKTTYDVAFSTSEMTTSTSGIGAVNIGGGGAHTFDADKSDALYFCVTLGNANNGQLLGVDVTYESSGETVHVTNVVLNKNSWHFVEGATSKLTATVLPVEADNKNVSWESSDDAVVTVEDGLLTAISAGTATVTVTTEDGGLTAECAVTVLEPDPLLGANFFYEMNTTEELTMSMNGYTVTISQGTFDENSNNCYKVYKGATLTISSTVEIGAVEFLCAAEGTAQYGPGCFTVSTGEYTYSSRNGYWTGYAKEIVFTASTNQVRLYEILISAALQEPYVTLDKSEVELRVTDSDGVKVKATAHLIDEPTFAWTTTSDKITLEGANTEEVTIKPNTDTEGSATVNLTVGGVTPAIEKSVSVSIIIAGPGETPETAYTVAQARAAIDTGTGVTGVYATGIVSQIVTAFNPTYGNISYNISADGETTSDQLQAYRGKSFDGEWFTSADDIKVGDEVIVVGNLKKYNSTYEFDTDNQLVVRNRISITLTPNEVLLDENEDGNIVDLFSDISITQRSFDNYTISDIVWASDDEDVLAIVDDAYIAGKAGSAKLTASLGGKEYAEVSVTVRKAEDPLTAINFTNAGDDLEVERNGNFQLTWALTPTHPTDGGGVKFSISDADAGSEISVTQEGLISAGSVPGVSAIVKIESDHNENIYDEVMVTVVMDEMYIVIEGEKAWSKATSLSIGDTIAFVNEDNSVELTGLDTDKNIGTYAAYETAPAATYSLTVGVGSAENSYTFQDEDGNYLAYINTSTSKNNYLYTVDSLEGDNYQKASWTINFDNWTITNVYNTSRKLRYNSTSGQERFCCYISGQNPVQIYKYQSSEEKIAVGEDLYNAVLAFNASFTCDASGETFAAKAFKDAGALFTAALKSTYRLSEVKADKNGNLVEQFLARYDYAVGKYSAEISDLDFLARDPAPVPSGSYVPLGSNAKSNAAATVIIIIAVLGVTAFGVYFLLRKRKEER